MIGGPIQATPDDLILRPLTAPAKAHFPNEVAPQVLEMGKWACVGGRGIAQPPAVPRTREMNT